MMKSKNRRQAADSTTETGRGKIRDNHLAALVTSRVFRTQVVKAQKGKGSYQRNNKHKGLHKGLYKGQEPCLIAA